MTQEMHMADCLREQCALYDLYSASCALRHPRFISGSDTEDEGNGHEDA